MEVEQWLDTQLGRDIWHKKYRDRNETFDEWLDRVSGGNLLVRKLIQEKKFLFGGRILANRGLNKLGKKVTLSNCYVLSPPKDSIESIFETAKKLARTFSYGGGVGIDISNLAPKGAKVNNTAQETTGATSFMDLYSMVTGLIGQNGRRGALMLSIDCSHPDVEEFIKLKSDLDRVTKANISVRISDDFMLAVENNHDWELSFERPETNEKIIKIVKAKDLFRLICKMNWDYAEPGALFWDRISNWNLLSEDENFEFVGVNPCAEEPLPSGGSCLLGSINLSEFVTNPFTYEANIDYEELSNAVRIAIGGLNEILHEGLKLHPLQEQQQSVNDWRQIGLGIFGWHDMLMKMGIEYGKTKSIDLAFKVGNLIKNISLQTSAELTKVYGTYPKYNQKHIMNSSFCALLDDKTKHMIEEYGLANSQLLTIAPTGSLGTMLGVSTGVEPIFNLSYTRKTESLHGEDKYYKVYTPIVKEYMDKYNVTDENLLPNFFNTAMTLDPFDRIDMQSAWQHHIDASISSTVNLPNSATIEEVEQLYMYAWKMGLKGVTIFRDGCKRMGILTNTSNNENGNKESASTLTWGSTLEASDDLIGYKRKIMSGCGSLHVQAWFDPVDGRLMEIYLSKGSTGGCNAFMGALSRTISAGLRTGLDFDYAIDQLNSVPACPSYVARTATKRDTSKGNNCPSAIANVLIEMQKEALNDIGYDDFYDDIDEDTNDNVERNTHQKEANKNKQQNINEKNKPKCPECGENLKFEGGCNSCPSCGWSKCE